MKLPPINKKQESGEEEGDKGEDWKKYYNEHSL